MDVASSCPLELSTVLCQSCLSKFILDKSTGSRSVLSLSSHSRFSLTRLTNYCPQGLCTLLTFSLRSCILLQWRDVTLLSTLVMRAVTHSFHLRDFTLMLQAHGISDNLWQMYRPLAYRDTWSVIPMPLRSSNPYDKPIFHAEYFTHPEDVKVCDSSWYGRGQSSWLSTPFSRGPTLTLSPTPGLLTGDRRTSLSTRTTTPTLI